MPPQRKCKKNNNRKKAGIIETGGENRCWICCRSLVFWGWWILHSSSSTLYCNERLTIVFFIYSTTCCFSFFRLRVWLIIDSSLVFAREGGNSICFPQTFWLLFRRLCGPIYRKLTDIIIELASAWISNSSSRKRTWSAPRLTILDGIPKNK